MVLINYVGSRETNLGMEESSRISAKIYEAQDDEKKLFEVT